MNTGMYTSYETTLESYKFYADSILNFLRKFIRSNTIREEIMQETFTRAYETGFNSDPRSARTRNYLLTTARNLAVDFLRKANTEKKLLDTIYISEVQLNDKFFNSVEEAVIDGEIISTFHGVIDSFPPEKRKVFAQKILLNRMTKEIAKEMNISRFIVNKIIVEITHEIKKRLGGYFEQNL